MNKLYSVHDHWTDIAKKNDVDIESIDGVIAGIKVNGEDFSGVSWETLFDGNVTTVTLLDIARAIIQDYELNADTIKVTFDGVEYECEKNANGSYGAVIVEISYDWSEYPFSLINTEGGFEFTTESAGTYTLKIEELQSGGGSSDFSTAEVTISTDSGECITCMAVADDEDVCVAMIPVSPIARVFSAILYRGHARVNIPTSDYVIGSVTGNATIEEDYYAEVTGDCTINLVFS